MTCAAFADPVEAPADDIEDRLREICGHLNVLHGQLVELTAEAAESGSWQGWGVRSLAHWLCWQGGLSPQRAAETVRLAAAHSTHPQLIGALSDGAVSVDQATIAIKAPTHLDGHFAEFAQTMTVAQLRVAVRAARPAPPPPPPPPAGDGEPSESFRGWFDDDCRYRFRGELDPDHGRELDAALREARDALFHAGQADVTWADALVEMARRSMDTAPVERRDRFRVNWFVNPADPVPARWADGLAVPDWVVAMLSCDGTISPVFTDGALPVSVGRTQHTIPERTRRLVLYRDRTCRVPWCHQTRWLEVHHLVHRQHGGGHNTPDLIAICPADHRLHHQGLLGIAGNADDPNGLIFTDATGRIIDPAAHPTKPTGPPPGPSRPYLHPLGERLDTRWLIFPDPPSRC
jgi:hypothetical protein